jgi:riboflavin kinase/FMN adenylyltransferase
MKFEFETMPGRREGTQMGFPALSLRAPRYFPYDAGIYAGKVWIGPREFIGAFHFGPVPMFRQHRPSLEVHILDANLAERPYRVQFDLMTYIREIRSFPTKEALAEQLKDDVAKVREAMKAYETHEQARLEAEKAKEKEAKPEEAYL